MSSSSATLWGRVREYVPEELIPDRYSPTRWLLLEGSRLLVTGALLLMVFLTVLTVGSMWTFRMQQLLTETSAVQTLLNTLLGGVILLVSIVASISAIVLSYDITSLNDQEERIAAAMEFRQDVGRLSESRHSPTDPGSFLRLMIEVMRDRSEAVASRAHESNSEFDDEIREYAESVRRTVDRLDQSIEDIGRRKFDALWRGLEADYGTHLNRSRELMLAENSQFSERGQDQFEELVRAVELFGIGKEYFKTLYYAREISKLSRTLLLISLPAILVTSSAILAIDAQVFPKFWLFGLPPLLTFVAFVFTVSLAPFAVLTSYMLRVATVAIRTASAGPFQVT